MLFELAMIRRLVLFVGLLGLCAGCAPPPPAPTVSPAVTVPVSGKVSQQLAPVSGVRVSAYPLASSTLAGRAPFVSPPTGSDGRFSLALPAGEYYFLARGEGYFSFYGRNPVSATPPGLLELNLGVVSEASPPAAVDAFVSTGVAGVALHGGVPVAGATIYVYTDLSSHLKGMGYVMAGPTDAAGTFEAALPAGTYYLLARQRHGRSSVGPLRAGDFIGYYPDNPLTVRDGEVVRVAIPMLEVPEKVERLAGSLFGGTALRGRILDPQGRPVAGVRAVLYDDARMLDRPLFVSQPSAADGSYVLSFPAGGTYYLGARDTLGGAPGSGELFGTYDASPDHSLQIGTDEVLEGIDIVVEKMW